MVYVYRCIHTKKGKVVIGPAICSSFLRYFSFSPRPKSFPLPRCRCTFISFAAVCTASMGFCALAAAWAQLWTKRSHKKAGKMHQQRVYSLDPLKSTSTKIHQLPNHPNFLIWHLDQEIKPCARGCVHVRHWKILCNKKERYFQEKFSEVHRLCLMISCRPNSRTVHAAHPPLSAF